MLATTIPRTATASRTRTRLALIVEYHPWQRLMLSNLFDESGFEVQFASNGAAGLRLAARLRPELVVVGDWLPELSPEQLIAELEALRAARGTRVVRARDLLRWEAHPACHTSRVATPVGDDDVRVPAVRHANWGRRGSMSPTRASCHVDRVAALHSNMRVLRTCPGSLA